MTSRVTTVQSFTFDKARNSGLSNKFPSRNHFNGSNSSAPPKRTLRKFYGLGLLGSSALGAGLIYADRKYLCDPIEEYSIRDYFSFNRCLSDFCKVVSILGSIFCIQNIKPLFQKERVDNKH